ELAAFLQHDPRCKSLSVGVLTPPAPAPAAAPTPPTPPVTTPPPPNGPVTHPARRASDADATERPDQPVTSPGQSSPGGPVTSPSGL
ncbi:MAG TPA: hypothetical protein VL588_05495, partial [Bdellovibrionota bacterium]|nr:hypothetical protein [Bdellovibrionota bacterium]